jgi:hypothetical protein
VLAKDPSQTGFDHWRTSPPIQAFQNGFIGWDAARIQRYFEGELPESALDPKTNITKEQFAMLNKKGGETETVVIYQLLEKSLTEEPSSDPDEDSEDDEGEEEVWWHWNVRFQDVDELVETLETMDALPVFFAMRALLVGMELSMSRERKKPSLMVRNLADAVSKVQAAQVQLASWQGTNHFYRLFTIIFPSFALTFKPLF